MKAVICTRYGAPEVLQIKQVEKPKPKDNEVLIKIHASTAHVGDTRIRRADPFLVRMVYGLFKPKKNLILGLEVSGIIEDLGKNVQSFKKGDKVFALTGFGLGAYAEYLCLPEKVKEGTQQRKGLVAIKPENLSFEEAAAIPAGGLTALKNLQKAKIRKGQKILINGASGSLGTYAIQLAKYYGAEVTAVCSGKNFELVKSIGADHTIDYTKEDFTQNGIKYDVIFDTVGKSSFWGALQSLTPKGHLLLASAGICTMLGGAITNLFIRKNIISGVIEETTEDMNYFKKLIENKQLKAVIDKIYPLERIVEAYAHVDAGHKKGNVIIRMGA